MPKSAPLPRCSRRANPGRLAPGHTAALRVLRVGTSLASQRSTWNIAAFAGWHGACYPTRRPLADDVTDLARRLLSDALRRRPRADVTGFGSRARRDASPAPGRSPRHGACYSPSARRVAQPTPARPLTRPGLMQAPPARLRSRGRQKALFLRCFAKYLLWITHRNLWISCPRVWKTGPILAFKGGVP